MLDVGVTVKGAVRIPARLREFAEQADEGIRVGLERFGGKYIRTLKETRLRGRPGLNRRSGELSRNFVLSAKVEERRTIRLRITNPLIYSRIQEEGGVVRPKRGQYLAIPLDAVKTKTGLARGGPRDYKRTFFHRTESGALILFQSPKSKGGKPIPLFAMVKQVTIPPRLGARDLMRAMAPDLKKEVSASLKRVKTETES